MSIQDSDVNMEESVNTEGCAKSIPNTFTNMNPIITYKSEVLSQYTASPNIGKTVWILMISKMFYLAAYSGAQYEDGRPFGTNNDDIEKNNPNQSRFNCSQGKNYVHEGRYSTFL